MSSAPQTVLDLVERFDRNLQAYRSGQYNETQVRIEFIDPLFKALGWDVDNVRGYAEAYKDVVHEDAIKIGGYTKAPDYCFRIGGARKFFVEAKKPSISVREEISPAYQLRRYAWSAKLPLSILTDFEEFAVYDCRVRPVVTDRASKARVLYVRYTDYPERWDEIATVFSREAVLKGSFDKYAESTRRKRGTAEVDAAFLQEIDSWRDGLARNLALRNPTLTSRQLNYAVQRTIDRIIFLRICEDRGIELYGRLQALLNGLQVYARLCDLYRQADERYNSGLFHFRHEKGRTQAPDELTPNVTIDDRLLKEIIKSLYYPDSPYEFSVLPADILGQVYEQFLGKVIRLTPGHRAKVEEKPEVKKAGGVYYTPTYIVDYVVEHTVGELLKESNPRKAARLRILDPACGSGSFLLGAYQRLLDWHRDWYVAHEPESWAARRNPCLFQSQGGEWRLTAAERKRILLNNIYGVDIDSQAVEVTKLSLLLKVLEGETGETLARQLAFFRERALPDLATNIKCGNSLIGTDFHEGQQASFLDEEEIYRINAFDWETEFPEIMAAGGFDAVIGNPPYIRIQMMKEWAPKEVEFYKQRYVSASRGNYDIYVVFVEKGLSLLNDEGRLGLILPSKFISTDYGEALRRLLSQARVVDRVVDFGHSQVFRDATTYTCLLFLDRACPERVKYLPIPPEQLGANGIKVKTIPAEYLGGDLWVLDRQKHDLVQKLQRSGLALLDLPAMMSRGTSTGADNIFCLKETNGQLTTRQGMPVHVEPEILRQPLRATGFTRYRSHPAESKEVIIFPYSVSEDKYSLIDESAIRSNWPKAYEYLRANRQVLEQRKQYQKWYGYSAPRNLNVHDQADFLVPLLANRGLVAPMPTEAGRFCVMASAGFSVSLQVSDWPMNKLYVLGLLNSALLYWNLYQVSNKFRGGWVTCTKQYFGNLPIRTSDFSDPADVARHDRMVALVERMLALHKQLAAAKTPTAKTTLQRQIVATDRQIDGLVYELYDLSEEEIGIVEGKRE